MANTDSMNYLLSALLFLPLVQSFNASYGFENRTQSSHDNIHNHLLKKYAIILRHVKVCSRSSSSSLGISRSSSAIVFIHDDHTPKIESYFRNYVDHLKRPILLYNIQNLSRNQTKEMLYNLYVHQKLSFFAIMVKHPENVMKTAEEIFHEYNRSHAAIMPHRSRWLIFVWEYRQRDTLEFQQKYSVMDNVCLIFQPELYNTSTYSTEYGPLVNENSHSAYTFFWNGDRTKRMEPVVMCNVSLEHKTRTKCAIFPNMQWGMNGRRINAYSAYYIVPQYFNMYTDPETKKEYYSGYRYEYLKLLAQNLNFTFNLLVMGEGDDAFQKFNDNKVWDFAMLLWSITETYKDLDVTFPIFYESVRGMYHNPEAKLSLSTMPSTLLFPFPALALVFIPSSIVLTAIIWMFVTASNVQMDHKKAQNKANRHPKVENDEKRKISEHEKSSSVSAQATASNQNQAKRHHDEHGWGPIKKLCQFFEIFWALSSTFVNQGSIPSTSWMSSRIVTWSFCISVVFFYAMYTGSITSERVRKRETLPFNNFEGMIRNGDYGWGAFSDSGVFKAVFANSTHEMFRELAAGMKTVYDRGDMHSIRTSLLDRISNNNFVFLYFDSLIANLLHRRDFILIPEKLSMMYRGFVVPKSSEFNDILTVPILENHDFGLHEYLLKKFNLSIKNLHVKLANEESSGGNEPVHILDIAALVGLVTVLIIAALTFLLIEIFITVCPILFFLRKLIRNIHSHGF